VALDVTMTNLYKDVLRRNPALSEDIKGQQTAWWRRREACNFNEACIATAETDRVAELKAIIYSPPQQHVAQAETPNVDNRSSSGTVTTSHFT